VGVLALAGHAPACAQAEPESTPPAKSAAMAEAEAHKGLVSRPPRPSREPDYTRSSETARAGEYGEVVIRGIVTEDGRFIEPAVVQSSRSSLVDAAALAFLPETEFEPARDASGKPLSIPITYSIEIPAVRFRGENSLLEYSCAQFVRDHDWWRTAWPDGTRDRVYKTLNGYIAVADLRGAFGGNAPRFEDDWAAAVESCRARPEARMIEQLAFYGKFISGMLKTRQ
jgi:TonB family protein